jgi:hypothetical protein
LLKLDLKDFKESAETQAVIQHQNLRGQSYYK